MEQLAVATLDVGLVFDYFAHFSEAVGYFGEAIAHGQKAREPLILVEASVKVILLANRIQLLPRQKRDDLVKLSLRLGIKRGVGGI